jgi:predicted nucleic acid-binding protein
MILSDTSILSSFAAAQGLPLLLAALEEDTIFIPPAVEQELQAGLARSVTYLQNVLDLIPMGQVQLLDLDESDLECMTSLPEALGPGEREAIALGLRHGAMLLCNDLRVVRYCDAQGILCLDLASLLRMLWTKGVATRAKVKTMIVRMERAENLVFKDKDRVFAPQKGVPL